MVLWEDDKDINIRDKLHRVFKKWLFQERINQDKENRECCLIHLVCVLWLTYSKMLSFIYIIKVPLASSKVGQASLRGPPLAFLTA